MQMNANWWFIAGHLSTIDTELEKLSMNTLSDSRLLLAENIFCSWDNRKKVCYNFLFVYFALSLFQCKWFKEKLFFCSTWFLVFGMSDKITVRKCSTVKMRLIKTDGKWSWGRISWDRNSTFSGGQIFDHEVKFVH